MIYYRLYYLDAAGRFRRARELHCRNDAHAIDTARHELAEGKMELWSFGRRVWSSAEDEAGDEGAAKKAG